MRHMKVYSTVECMFAKSALGFNDPSIRSSVIIREQKFRPICLLAA